MDLLRAEALRRRLRPQHPHQGPHRHRLSPSASSCSYLLLTRLARSARPQSASFHCILSSLAVFLAHRRALAHPHRARQPHPGPSRRPHLRRTATGPSRCRPTATSTAGPGSTSSTSRSYRYLNLRVPRDYDTVPLWLFLRPHPRLADAVVRLPRSGPMAPARNPGWRKPAAAKTLNPQLANSAPRNPPAARSSGPPSPSPSSRSPPARNTTCSPPFPPFMLMIADTLNLVPQPRGAPRVPNERLFLFGVVQAGIEAASRPRSPHRHCRRGLCSLLPDRTGPELPLPMGRISASLLHPESRRLRPLLRALSGSQRQVQSGMFRICPWLVDRLLALGGASCRSHSGLRRRRPDSRGRPCNSPRRRFDLPLSPPMEGLGHLFPHSHQSDQLAQRHRSRSSNRSDSGRAARRV